MVTKLVLTVDNHLYAATVGAGTEAILQKESFGILVTPDGDVVPEPSTALLGLLSLGGLLFRRMRVRIA
jgi:MYXO-CTERM domain-containing protein